MKNIFKPLIAIVFLIGILSNSVEAQMPSAQTTTSSDLTDSSGMDRKDDSGKWGLLGLLGFLGLIKWNNDKRTGTYTASPLNR